MKLLTELLLNSYKEYCNKDKYITLKSFINEILNYNEQEAKVTLDYVMKELIKHELTLLKEKEIQGSDKYNELTEEIDWLE